MMYQSLFKRISDLMISLIFLTIALPFLIILIILFWSTGHRPVFFIQPRVGRNNQIFNLIKFRTMTNRVDKEGRLLPDAQRMTSFGSLMRKMSIDEIPQLWNVVTGDMSLIGPRPLLPEYLPLYNEEQKKRHLVKPGITGWAQVNGRNALTWKEKFEKDIYYINNISFKLDLVIFFKTIKKIFTSEGISQDGHATMEPFRGNN